MRRSGFIPILVVLAAFIFIGIAIAVIFLQHKIAPTPPKSIATSQYLEAASTPINTSDWKTYENKQYGFQLQYLPDWSINLRNDQYVDNFVQWFGGKQATTTDQAAQESAFGPFAFSIQIFDLKGQDLQSAQNDGSRVWGVSIDLVKECHQINFYGIAAYDCFSLDGFEPGSPQRNETVVFQHGDAGFNILITVPSSIPPYDGYQDSDLAAIFSTFKFECGTIPGVDYLGSVDALTSQERTSLDCFYQSLVSCDAASLSISGNENGNANGAYAIKGIQGADCLISKSTATSTKSCNVPRAYITMADQGYNQNSLNPEGTKKAMVKQILDSVSIEKQYPWGSNTSFTALQCQ